MVDIDLPQEGSGSWPACRMNVQYVHLQCGDPLPALAGFSTYRTVVVIEDVADSEWQAAASRWLADSGCLYMIAWRKDCNVWDDGVDLANLGQFGYRERPDGKFIVTTRHDHESLEEVVRFAKHSAHHPTIELENVLFLHIGAADRQSKFESLYRNA